MIFDRTQSDVVNALKIREEKVQKFRELTEYEIAVLEKGFLTINTLNRIEEKQQELKNALNEMAYYGEEIENKEWFVEDYFLQEDFERMLFNLQKLKDAFFVRADTPEIPDKNYRKYQNINAVERILYDIADVIKYINENYRECGDYECGGGD